MAIFNCSLTNSVLDISSFFIYFYLFVFTLYDIFIISLLFICWFECVLFYTFSTFSEVRYDELSEFSEILYLWSLFFIFGRICTRPPSPYFCLLCVIVLLFLIFINPSLLFILLDSDCYPDENLVI